MSSLHSENVQTIQGPQTKISDKLNNLVTKKCSDKEIEITLRLPR